MPIETEQDRFWNLLNKHLDYNIPNLILNHMLNYKTIIHTSFLNKKYEK